jgi:Bacterial Ig domain
VAHMGGNSIIALSRKRHRFHMRPLAVLLGLFLLASPLLVFPHGPVQPAEAGSLPSWNKVFHLHDGTVMAAGTYDWANATGPYNPTWRDYDGDGVDGITIKKNVPPQRYHSWYLYPAVNSSVDITGSLGVHLWVFSQGNESGTIVSALFYDVTQAQFSDPFLGTLIEQGSSGLVGPFYSNWQMIVINTPSVAYTLPQGHYLAVVVQRGDSLNDWLVVWYDRSDYDSYITMQTSDFVSIVDVHSEDLSATTRTVFTDVEDVNISANVTDPYGNYDIQGANVSISYQSNQTVVWSLLPMTLVQSDPSPIPYWRIYRATMPMLTSGTYIANVTARDYSGYPTWLTTTFTIVSADHFNVSCPSTATAGTPFSLTITAKDQFNSTITNWVGPVLLGAFLPDKTTERTGSLSISEANFNLSDLGQVTISSERYWFGEEQVYIRASAGASIGWSGLMTVSSGPVVNLTLFPSSQPPMGAGATQVFTATGRDYLGNVNSTWTPFWEVNGGVGYIQGSGTSVVFHATTIGVGNITCTSNATGASSNVSISVLSGTLARINISSPSYPLMIHEGEVAVLTAAGYDSIGNPVSIVNATWDTTTSGIVNGSGPLGFYTAGMVPQTGTINVRYMSIVGTLQVVVENALEGPWLNPIPAQIRNEDTGTWELSLTGYWQDVDGTTDLFWWVEDVNTSLYFISHDSSHNSVIHFSTQPDQSGDDVFVLWVIDPQGHRTYQNVQVRILAINDRPLFVNNVPTELYVKFGEAYTFDYSYYVHDVDDENSRLAMTSDAPKLIDGFLWNVSFDGLIGTFTFNRKDGETPYFQIVTVEVYDPMHAFDEEKIVVRVTKDTPPALNRTLEDITIYEGETMHFAFDLDDYFYDPDGEPLFYTAGFDNIPPPFIDPATHAVYFSSPGEWSGVTQGAFIANDTTGALKVDTVNVTVTPVNDEPQVQDIKEVMVKYDVPYYLYLSSFVYDPDNSLDSLTFDISTSYVTEGVSETGAYRLRLLFPSNLTGPVFTDPYRVLVWMNVSDPGPDVKTNRTTFSVMVTDDNPPVVIAERPDQLYYTFPEDTYLNDSLLLFNIFSDPDSGDTLTFTILSDGDMIHYEILSTGAVSLSAELNWNGMETLTINATDQDGAWASVQAYVIVTPVNDAPIAFVVHEKYLISGSRNLVFDLDQLVYFYDPDGDPLTITVSPEANAVVVGNKLYVTLPSGVNSITVTLQAADGELSSNMVSVKVGISRSMAEKIGFPYSLPLVLLAAGVAGYFLGIKLPRPYALENLFLIHNDGRLVAHVTKEENTTLDKDVVSAMFTAVQEFVRDSFQKGEIGLKKLEIGDKNVLIEKGRSVYIALIYSGWPQKEVFDMLPMLLRDVEERYKDRIEHWNGTMKAVPGVQKMLQEYMMSAYKPGAWHDEEEIAEAEWVDILSKET